MDTVIPVPAFPPALLRDLALRAHAALPLANGRIDRAVEIVASGGVTPSTHGYLVRSQAHPGSLYPVNGVCVCHDASTAPHGGICKHRAAVALYRRAIEALAAVEAQPAPPTEPLTPALPPQETPPAIPLPEAPASANCYIQVAGRQVQLTLRDSDEARLLQRLQAVLAGYPAPERAAARA